MKVKWNPEKNKYCKIDKEIVNIIKVEKDPFD